jgi:hypothetical protein
MEMRLAIEVRGRRRAAAIRKNVWRHARGRLLLLCPYSKPLDLRVDLLPGHVRRHHWCEAAVPHSTPVEAGETGTRSRTLTPGEGSHRLYDLRLTPGQRRVLQKYRPSTPDYASQNASQK